MLELIGENITLDDMVKATNFINNISGTYILIPIINEWNFQVMLQFKEGNAKRRTHSIDRLYSNFVNDVDIKDLMKIFSIYDNFTVLNNSSLVDFVLNFAKFEEKIKYTYLKGCSDSPSSFDDLYKEYREKLKEKGTKDFESEMVSKDKLVKLYPEFEIKESSKLNQLLNQSQKKIYINRYMNKYNKLNNFPQLIKEYQHRESIVRICQDLLDKSDKDLDEIDTFEEIKNLKTQRLWLLYNLFMNPSEVTNFRNKCYHTLEVHGEANKTRVYSDTINLALMIIKYLELGIEYDNLIKLLENTKYNWSGIIRTEVLT